MSLWIDIGVSAGCSFEVSLANKDDCALIRDAGQRFCAVLYERLYGGDDKRRRCDGSGQGMLSIEGTSVPIQVSGYLLNTKALAF